MSTRWYPLYQRGNPQLRVFLPNFWLKLVRPETKLPPNIVQFHCSMEMTKSDIKNYLEKIYKVPITEVRTRIALGRYQRDYIKGYITKDDDVKMAYVTLPKDAKFEFPEVCETKDDREKDDAKGLDETKKNYREYLMKNKHRANLPGWFSI